jgi:hypothetical protein
MNDKMESVQVKPMQPGRYRGSMASEVASSSNRRTTSRDRRSASSSSSNSSAPGDTSSAKKMTRFSKSPDPDAVSNMYETIDEDRFDQGTSIDGTAIDFFF